MIEDIEYMSYIASLLDYIFHFSKAFLLFSSYRPFILANFDVRRALIFGFSSILSRTEPLFFTPIKYFPITL